MHDFKSEFDPSDKGQMLEFMKDVVAFANSGGGLILIGVSDDGEAVGNDVGLALDLDPATLTDRIHKYTGTQFDKFSIHKREKDGMMICVYCIGQSRVPMVFKSEGSYTTTGGQNKKAFALGTTYFRHGAKSEPGNTDDLRAFVEREVESIRSAWLDGITRIVEAPIGSTVRMIPPNATDSECSDAVAIRLTKDETAKTLNVLPIDKTHPYRQKEVIEELNARLAGVTKITSHDLQCIRKRFRILEDINLCYTQKHAAPKYSSAYVDWILEQYAANVDFFKETKEQFAPKPQII